ncbi:hypothetical protein GCM10008909_15320 [Hathewaya limosa]
MMVHANPINKNISQIEAKAICKNIDQSIKNGTYKFSNLSVNESIKKSNHKIDEIKVKVLKEKSDDVSMAGGYIEKVEHEVSNGKQYLVLSIDSLDWMSNITASINDGQEVKVEELEISKKKKNDGKGKEIGKIRFEIKNLNSKILMHMNVEPMGNARVTFRLIPETTITDQGKPKKEDTQPKDKQKDKETDIVQNSEKKEKTEGSLKIKWEKVTNISQITSIKFGKFYGDFEKYRVEFEKPSYDPNMAIYMKNFNGIEVNGVTYKKADSAEKKETFYFGSMGLELNPSAFKQGENMLIFKSKGHNDLRIEVNKKSETINIIKQEEGIKIDTQTGSEVSGKPKHNIADGIYTVGFKANKVDNPNDTSMLGGFLDHNVKVEVKEGKIKLTFLHKVMADMLIDVRFESEGKYIPAKLTYYTSPKGKTVDKMKTIEVEVSDLSNPHNCAVLVTGMGGKLIDKGHMDKYKIAKLTFNDELVEGWKGFEEKREVKTSDELFNDALVAAHLDKDNDGIVTDEEIKQAAYGLELNSKRIKDITRLKNLGSKVTELNLGFNEISDIKEGTFDNIINVEKLSLTHNEIKSLPNNIFDKLTKLRNLDISENNLKDLPEELFKNLENLEELSIRECNIEELPDGIFKNLKNLRTLSLVGNKLSHIPKAIFELNNLESLYISENMLEELPKELSNLKKLRVIDSQHNFINKIDNEFYENIRKNNNIKTLNLRDNELKEVPKDMAKMFNLNGISSEIILNNVINMPNFEDDVMKKVYPQKSFTNFKAQVKNNKITWKSDLSVLDMLCWQRAVDRNSKNIKNVKEYKQYLAENGAKTAGDVLKKEGLMWEVVTDIQKKNADGKYVTIKTFKDKEDNNTGTYEESSVNEKNQYRILKKVNGATYEEFSYLLGQMAEVKVASEETSKEVVKDKIKDGTYSIGFTAYKVEDRKETSMLNNFFDKKAKLEVKDGKMKITLLNICFADGLYDFRIESNGKFPESIAKGYGKLTPKGQYPFKTFEVNISDIDLEHEGCVLVGPMGGLISDIGNFDRYRKVMFVFDKDNLKEWNGFDEDHKKIDDDKQFNKALVDAKLDKDGDGIVTNEELALAEGEVNLARKGIKDISRLQFLGKNVTSLDLVGNEITELPEGVFDNLTKLKKLDIHGNYIKKLPKGIFDKLTELTELHIGMNDFTELPEGIFDRLTKLKELSIYNMRLSLNKIDDNIFDKLKNLEYLSLAETGISKIPKSIFKLDNIKTLNLNKNQLRVIPKELSNLKNLTWLDLGTNYIEEIPEEVYKSLNKLTMFEIKDNQLTKIPLNIWELMPENKTLNCSLNKLKIVPNLPDPSKGKIWFTNSPQKQALNLKLNAKNGEIAWSQDISSVDMMAWWRIANSFNTKKVPKNLDEYKKQLGGKTAIDFLKKGWTEPQIITKIQKKDINGNYITIKEITNYNENDHSDSIKDSKMKNGDEYRILKKLEAVSFGSPTYVCTDVAYAKAIVNENISENPDTKPTNPKDKEIPTTKSEVQKEIQVKALKENSNEPSMAGEYLEKIVKYTEKDGKKYFTVTLNRMDWMKNIAIEVGGKEVEAEKKINGNIGEFTFEVESENTEVMMRMNVVPMGNARVAFRLAKEQDSQASTSASSEKPSTKPESTENISNKEEKPVEKEKENQNQDNIEQEKKKEENNQDKKDNIKEDKDINAKILKVVENNNLKSGNYKNVQSTIKCKNKEQEKLIKENLEIKTDVTVTKEKDVIVRMELTGKYAFNSKVFVDGKQVDVTEIFKDRIELMASPEIKTESKKDNNKQVVEFKLPNINSKVELVTFDSNKPNEKIQAIVNLKNDLVNKSLDKSTLSKDNDIKEDKDNNTKDDNNNVKEDNNNKEDGNNDVKEDNINNKEHIYTNEEDSHNKKTSAVKNHIELKSSKKPEQTVKNENKDNEKISTDKKLPQTGLPINTGILASMGTILSGLGIALRKKIKK